MLEVSLVIAPGRRTLPLLPFISGDLPFVLRAYLDTTARIISVADDASADRFPIREKGHLYVRQIRQAKGD